MKRIILAAALFVAWGRAEAALIKELPYMNTGLSGNYIKADGMEFKHEKMGTPEGTEDRMEMRVRYRLYKDKESFLAGRQILMSDSVDISLSELGIESVGTLAQLVLTLDIEAIEEWFLRRAWPDAVVDGE